MTVSATWYQLRETEGQANAAEAERARAVRQSIISIVEEQSLNGIKLEAGRINRLIDQRRREHNVSLQVSPADVVEQAEFNITSSTYLGVARKEQIKPIFDAFYADFASRSVQTFPPDTPNVALLNELAKQIQEGKTAPALANLRRLQELNSETVSQLTKKLKPTFVDAFAEFISQPKHIAIFALVYGLLICLVTIVRRRRRIGFNSGRLL
jgi:hypothetical protein